MASTIIKLRDFYMEWGSICDAPRTFGMTLKAFKGYYQFEYGASGMQLLDSRLERVEAKGTSSHIYDSAGENIELNRAGPDEMELTADEIYRAYCLREPINGMVLDDGGRWTPDDERGCSTTESRDANGF